MGDRDNEDEEEGQMVETIVRAGTDRARFSVAGLIKFFLMQVGSPAARALLQIRDKTPLNYSIWIDKDTQRIYFDARKVTTSAGFTARRTYDFVDPLMAAGLCEKLKKALYVWNGAEGFKKMVRGLAEYENLGIDLGLSEEDGLRLVAEVIMTFPPQVFYPLPADSDGPIKDLIDELVEQKLDKKPNPDKSFEAFRERVATIRRKTKRGGPQDICRMFLYLMLRSFGTPDAERTQFNTAEMRAMVRTAAGYMVNAASASESIERRLYDFVNMLVNCGFARDTGLVARDDGVVVTVAENNKKKAAQTKKKQARDKREREGGKWGIRKNCIYEWTPGMIASPPEGDEQYAILGGRMSESLDAEDREIKIMRELLEAKQRANIKRKATLARTLRKKKREEMEDPDEDDDDDDNDPQDKDYVGSATVDPIPPATVVTTRTKKKKKVYPDDEIRVIVPAPRPPTVSPDQVTVSKRAITLRPKTVEVVKKKKAAPAPEPVQEDGDDDDGDEIMLDASPYYSSGDDMPLFGDQGREILSVSDGSSSSSSSSHDSIFNEDQPIPKKTTTLGGIYGYAPPPPGL